MGSVLNYGLTNYLYIAAAKKKGGSTKRSLSADLNHQDQKSVRKRGRPRKSSVESSVESKKACEVSDTLKSGSTKVNCTFSFTTVLASNCFYVLKEVKG